MEECSKPDSKYFLRARFGHAETIIPLAALLEVPDLSDQSVPANETYTYETNNWRGELVSPMAANIQWDIFRCITSDSHHAPILIRMLYNEYPVKFKTACQPYDYQYPFFYTINELKRCYNMSEL